jgi:hypothetical protein
VNEIQITEQELADYPGVDFTSPSGSRAPGRKGDFDSATAIAESSGAAVDALPLSYPHASDCSIWVGERCDCVIGRDVK